MLSQNNHIKLYFSLIRVASVAVQRHPSALRYPPPDLDHLKFPLFIQ